MISHVGSCMPFLRSAVAALNSRLPTLQFHSQQRPLEHRVGGGDAGSLPRLARKQQLMVPGQETTIVGSWPGSINKLWLLARNHSQVLVPVQTRTFVGSWQKANNCWLLARNRHQLLVPGKEPLTIVGCWTGTTNSCRFLARSQQLLAPGQEPPTIVGSWL